MDTTKPKKERLDFHAGGTCIRVFGLPFVFGGLAVWASLVLGDVTSQGGYWWLLLIPIGFVFVAIGGLLSFGRLEVHLDRAQGIVHSFWGILIPIKHRRIRLEDITSVSISREIRDSDGDSLVFFLVHLECDGEPIDLGEDKDYAKARQQAEHIAKTLEKSLLDKTTGVDIESGLDELGFNVSGQIQRAGPKLALPSPPPKLSSRFRFEPNGELIVEIPATGFQKGHSAMLAICLVFSVFATWIIKGFFMDVLPATIGEHLQWPNWLILTVLPMALFGAIIVRSALHGEKLEVNATELCFRRPPQSKSAMIIPLEELKELKLMSGNDKPDSPPKTLMARSDSKMFCIGTTLEPEELQWLHDLIRFAMSRRV